MQQFLSFAIKAVSTVTHLLAHGLDIFAVSLLLPAYVALKSTDKILVTITYWKK